MKVDPSSDTSRKSPEQRFAELGRKIMSVPKAEVDARDKAWQAGRKRKRKASAAR
jgi:hypothetical protein